MNDKAKIKKLEAALNEILMSGRIRNKDKRFQERIETIISEAFKDTKEVANER